MFAQPTFPASVLRRASTSELLDLKNSSSAFGFGCSPSWLFALGIRWSSLVCDGLVSVSVRPERLSAAGTTRDAGHHSRLVPISCCWPPRHAALAPTALAAASRFVGSSPCPGLRGCTAGRCAGRRCLLAQAAWRSSATVNVAPVTSFAGRGGRAGARHWGPSLATARTSTGRTGAACASSLPARAA